MSPQRRNLIVGIVVVGALLALGGMILRFSNTVASSLFQRGMTITLLSDRVDGVNDGSPIYYLGVNVGRVNAVKRMSDNQKVVITAVIEDPNLPHNLTGVIRQQSALGSTAAISLELIGAPSAEKLRDGDQLSARFQTGGVVPSEFSDVAIQIREQRLVQHVDEAVVAIRLQADQVGKLLEQASALIGDPMLREDIKGAIASIRKTSDNLDKFSGHLDGLATETKATLTQVRTTVADTGQRVDQVSKDVGERLHEIGDVVAKLQSVATKIDKGEGTAGQLVNDPRLYESMVDSSKELHATIKALKRVAEQIEQEGITLKLK